MNLVTTVTTDDIRAPPALPPLPVRAPRRQIRRHAQAAEMRRRNLEASVSGGQGYQSAAVNRLNRDWLTTHLAADAAIGASWDSLTRRARDLKRNEPWANQAIERIVQNVIGDEGLRAESEVEIDGELDEEANAEIDEWYERWAEEADAEGRLHLAEIQALAMAECAEVGQCFLVSVQLGDKNRTIPLAYQLLEAEQLRMDLDWPLTNMGGAPATALAAGNRIRRGIEMDRYNRPVAYHFWQEHPYDYQAGSLDSIRVPAARVIHLFRKTRPSQTQGITWFAPILQSLRDLGQYIGDEMTAASVGAKFVVAIKRAVGMGTGLGFGTGDATDTGTDRDGNPLEELGAGIIADLAAGDEIEQIESKRPAAQAGPWIKLILETMANGIGLTYLGLTGDVTQASFSSARFARLQDKTFWRILQGLFGRTVVVPMRRAVVQQLVAFGRLRSVSPTQFAAQRTRWLATRLLPHGWEEIQVQQEVEAAIRRIQAGLSTLQIESANFGRNWRRIFKQRARELAYAKQLGLDLAVDYPGPVNGTVADAQVAPGLSGKNPNDPSASRGETDAGDAPPDAESSQEGEEE